MKQVGSALVVTLFMVGCATTKPTGLGNDYFLVQSKNLIDLVQMLDKIITDEDDRYHIEYAEVEANDLWDHFTDWKPGDDEVNLEIIEHANALLSYLSRIENRTEQIDQITDRATVIVTLITTQIR